MEIKKYTAVNKGNLLGFCNVFVPKWGVIVNDIGVFQKNGNRWVNLPSRQYEHEGEKKYFPYIGFDTKEMKEEFGKRVLLALDEYCKQEQPQKAKSNDNEELPF